jgi:DNA repair protein RadC
MSLQAKNPDLILPREKLEKFGVDNLASYELLAILLQTGTKDKDVLELSREILSKYSLSRFQTLTLDELTKIKGISTAKACKILAAVGLGRKILNKQAKLLPVIDTTKKAAEYLSKIANYKKEVLVALYLNSHNQIIHEETISIGNLNSVIIHPREIFEPALRQLSAFVIIAHNHPSGIVTPSIEDIKMTENLKKAGEILGIELIDSLVITSSDYISIFKKIS